MSLTVVNLNDWNQPLLLWISFSSESHLQRSHRLYSAEHQSLHYYSFIWGTNLVIIRPADARLSANLWLITNSDLFPQKFLSSNHLLKWRMRSSRLTALYELLVPLCGSSRSGIHCDNLCGNGGSIWILKTQPIHSFSVTSVCFIMYSSRIIIPCLLWFIFSAASWCHQMETFSTWWVLCAVNSPVTGEFPSQRPVTWSFDVFFDLLLNKHLSEQLWGWWFEMQWPSLWRHWNDIVLDYLHIIIV